MGSRHSGYAEFTREEHEPSPYQLDILDSCLTCKVRESSFFCHLPRVALQKFDKLKSVATYPKGAFLFMEGQICRGVFVLCQGRVKLFASSSEGKNVILRVAHPGEVLGLSAAVAGRPYLATAKTIEPAQANFVVCEDFLTFLRQHGEAALRAAQVLSYYYYAAYETIRTLGIAHSASEKLAHLILGWPASTEQRAEGGKPTPINIPFTHAEIAEMIGSSRETVERLLSALKRRHVIRLSGSTLTILNRAALESLIHY